MFLDIYFKISYIPMIYFLEFFTTFAYSIRFLQENGYFCITDFSINH